MAYFGVLLPALPLSSTLLGAFGLNDSWALNHNSLLTYKRGQLSSLLLALKAFLWEFGKLL